MRDCLKDIYLRMLSGTGLDKYSELKWYHVINETWFIVTLFIVWIVCLIVLVMF